MVYCHLIIKDLSNLRQTLNNNDILDDHPTGLGEGSRRRKAIIRKSLRKIHINLTHFFYTATSVFN